MPIFPFAKIERAVVVANASVTELMAKFPRDEASDQ